MRVLLTIPHDPYLGNYTVIPHVGLGFLAGALRQNGHDVLYLDAIKEQFHPKDFEEYLDQHRPDVIGFSFFSPSFNAVRIYANIARRRLPQCRIIVGGPHTTFQPKSTLISIPEIDFGVQAEGERALGDLMNYLETNTPPLSSIDNIVYRQGEQIVVNPVSFIEDLASLPEVAWDLLDPGTYPLMPNGIFSRKPQTFPVNIQRGCPYPCAFCGASKTMGKKIRFRPLNQVVNEIVTVTDKYNIQEFHIMDDNFTSNREYLLDFCHQIQELQNNLFWACPNGVRIDTLDKQTIRAMDRAGCYSIAVGIESGNQEILNMIGKHLKLETIIDQLALIRRYSRLRVTGFFILGLPPETEKTITETVRFSLRLPLSRANFFNYSPFPGSRLYDEIKENRKLGNNNLSDLFIHQVTYAPDGMTVKRLAQLVFRAHLRFYLRAPILWGLLHEIHHWSQVRVIAVRAWNIMRNVFRPS